MVNVVEQESDSFLQNFLLLLKAAFTGIAVSIPDTANVSRSCLGFSALAASYGITNSNIVIGTGNTAVTPTDYKLQNQITAMEHVPLLVVQPTVPALNGSYIECMICSRSFNNRSGAEIDVNEIGICVIASTYSILILRDVVAMIPVLDNQTIQVAYKFRTAV